jgi:hypothetical protein
VRRCCEVQEPVDSHGPTLESQSHTVQTEKREQRKRAIEIALDLNKTARSRGWASSEDGIDLKYMPGTKRQIGWRKAR